MGYGTLHLHGQGPVDEVGGLVVDVLHLDDHPLVVRICTTDNKVPALIACIFVTQKFVKALFKTYGYI